MTLSSTLKYFTPGPTFLTIPVPSWPKRCGKNLSFPFTPEISPSCDPQMPL